MLENEVKTPTVSKQYLLDLANRGELKQPERDLLRKFIDEEGDVVDTASFAAKVKTELLPLKRNQPFVGDSFRDARGADAPPHRYENVTLPDELRGPVANYSEHVYESPIKTSAGEVHFGNSYDGANPNYFAHTRIEDLPGRPVSFEEALNTDKKGVSKLVNQIGATGYGTPGTIRRVIEIQSDLFQKGRLEGEKQNIQKMLDTAQDRRDAYMTGRTSSYTKEADLKKELADKEKLEPYRNTWWERVVREEVKQAAADGKTKLQFPTGETAMKIEGLGERTQFFNWDVKSGGYKNPLTPETLEVGLTIRDQGVQPWVITEVIGDGKFKAIPKQHYERAMEAGGGGMDRMVDADRDIRVRDFAETFDISGKVDTNNPIYRFYEKDVQKYLTKKYGAKVITDPQGVKWIELNVPKDAGKLPVEAFGALPAIPALLGEKGDPKDRE